MTIRLWCLTTLLLTASACHFDESVYSVGGNEESSDTPSIPDSDPSLPEDALNPEPPDVEVAGRHFASSESTPNGVVMSGSYESLDAMDGSAEMLLGAVDIGIEKLEQRWNFSNVPAGQFELTFVAEVYSPLALERITISYRSVGETQWRDVLRLRPGIALTSYVNRVDVSAPSDLEFRALLSLDAPALMEVIDEEGGTSFEPYVPPDVPPAPDAEGETPDVEEFVPQRSMHVDYLRLVERNPEK